MIKFFEKNIKFLISLILLISLFISCFNNFKIFNLYSIGEVTKKENIFKHKKLLDEYMFTLHLPDKIEGDKNPLIGSGDERYYYYKSNQLFQKIKNNKGIFLENSLPSQSSWLHVRSLAFLKLIFSKFSEDESKFLIFLFIFNSVLFFLAKTYFYIKLKNVLDLRVIFFIILFLSFDPTINQFHYSLMKESTFLSLLLVFFTHMLCKQSVLNSLFKGIILGICYLQGTIIFYVPFLVIIFYFMKFRKNSIKKIISFLSGFLLLISYLAYENFERTNQLFLKPLQGITVLTYGVNRDLIPKVTNANNEYESLDYMKKKYSLNFTYNRKINHNDQTEVLLRKEFEKLEKGSINEIILNPLDFLFVKLKSLPRNFILDPQLIENVYKYNIGKFSKIERDNFKIIRSIYSLIIFGFIFYGIKLIWRQHKELTVFALLFFVYLVIASNLTLNTNRYLLPAIIFLSFFIGNALQILFSKDKKYFI